MNQTSQRIQFLDIMRGVAVIVMVMGHSIDAVLDVDTRTSIAFRMYDAFRGFTAPMFLFVSGFSFSIVTGRRWSEYITLSSRLRSRVVKLLILLGIGYALHLPFFSFTKLLHGARPEELDQFFQVDVLHCLAVSLLLLQACVFLARNQRAFGFVAAGVASAIVLVSPLVWSVNFFPILGPILSPYFNQYQITIFPLFPFAGFIFAGAVAGHYFLRFHSEGVEQRFFSALFKVAVVALATGVILDLLPITIYPPHDYWKSSPNFFLVRLSAVLLVTVGFYHLENMPSLIKRNLVTLGQASLLVYTVHLMVVYGSPINYGLTQLIGQILPYYAAIGSGMAVLFTMIVFTHTWNYAQTHHVWPARFIQAGFVGTVTYLFFTNPW